MRWTRSCSWRAAGAQVDAVEHELAQAQHRAADLLALDDVAGLGVEWATMSRTRVSIRAEPVGPSSSISAAGRSAGRQDPGAQGVVDVVVDVGDAVDQLHDPALERRRLVRAGVVEDAVADLLGQVEAGAVALEHVDDPQRVHVVLEAAARRARAAPRRARPRRCGRRAGGRGRGRARSPRSGPR